MSSNPFKKAQLRKVRVRMGACGPSKSGKSYGLSLIAEQMLKSLKEHDSIEGNGRIAAIDTEEKSLSKYADIFDFDVVEMDQFSPEIYMEYITKAEEQKYSILIVDGISHEWAGKGGLLEYKSKVAATQGYNEYTAWGKATPKHNAFTEAIIRFKGHIFCTVRAKMDYVLETNEKGKQQPVKVGMGPIQRDSTEYEFDIFAQVTENHYYNIGGSRCRYLTDRIFSPETVPEIGTILGKWVSDTIHLESDDANSKLPIETIKELQEIGKLANMTDANWMQVLSSFGASSFNQLLPEQAEQIKGRLSAKIEREKSKLGSNQRKEV